MENGGKNITEIKLYECGYCVNNLSHVFRKHQKEHRIFPALVALIKHKELGNILFDTGYSELIYQNGFVSFLYNAINRSYVKPEDSIYAKLMADGEHPEQIKRIILSHAHPDHIGGLRLFDNYELISTQTVIDTLKGGNPFKLVFRNMIPDGNVKYTAVKEYAGESFLCRYFDRVYDVLSDGSVIGVELNGHAKGQLGIYLPEQKKLLVADACWGKDLLGKVGDMRFIARHIQDNYKEYLHTAKALMALSEEHPEINIIYSHDKTEEIPYGQA